MTSTDSNRKDGLADRHVPDFDPVAADEAIVRGPNVRITVLTPRTLRLEYDPTGAFEDRPSQLVWYRDQPVPDFEVVRGEDRLVVETDALVLEYDHADDGFTAETLSVELADGTVWTYGDEDDGNLGGALRTVDQVDGAAPLEDGLVSRDGWALVDDTERLVFDDEWVQPRDAPEAYEDLYFFGDGNDYQRRLEDFRAITGDVPMIPRWALGNWWSRYWEYTQEELRGVVEGFQERDIPLSVCVIDMDWHVVENDYHDGWTGWTWNDEYFPDPEGFIEWLHDNDVRTTLNLHPAEGVHPHEAQYEDFAAFMGSNPENEEPIEFDASDQQFLRGYFEHLIDPMEDEDGIDFWWIDWQQWEESPEMDGLDPLWALNHLHALDRTRTGKRPFIFSRWPGLGGHRYPIGFSGDSYISWESLRFQPHLTATSANVAYGWWSHDIGGHMGGEGDSREFAELYARWAQFGVFSPINRIHTTKHRFVEKRPWAFDDTISATLEDALTLRHELIPYLYTMAWRDHTESVPLVRPMYYHHPEAEAAYETVHQYYFGSELLAAPHLSERDDETNLARRSVWLPEGEWFDFCSGEYHEGGRWLARYGDLEDLPVYAKAGGIVPMDADANGDVSNPERMRIVTFPGADNRFELYEDDGTTMAHRDGAYATTELAQTFDGDRLTFEIEGAEGDRSQLPEKREYELQFRGVTEPTSIEIEGGADYEMTYRAKDATLVIDLDPVAVEEAVTIVIETDAESLVDRRDRTKTHVEDLLWSFKTHVTVKEAILEDFEPDGIEWLADYVRPLTDAQLRALAETITGAGVDLLDHDGEDRIVVWNPEDAPVSYRFSAWDWSDEPMWGTHESERGEAPQFAAFDVSDPAVEGEVRLDYEDVFAATAESSAPDEPEH
ncbi:glycoside hydrolase family 31 protein [Halorhabdus amylolytica]|uniref:glycoside hydrolase family 31 protein n=1 Tax=Halorhabdus amylolytica TaxID=2559573 RepID=UPI0010AADAC8|nr:glycoside hydrolase family 31 protein [Halorhabdus amylolytica]